MTVISNRFIPRYLQVAHWLHKQQRFVSIQEAANFFDVSSWSMYRDFSKIKLLSDVVIFDEQRVTSKGGPQNLLRVLYIYNYTLDKELYPHRQYSDVSNINHPITWSDLLCTSWGELVNMQKRRDNQN